MESRKKRGMKIALLQVPSRPLPPPPPPPPPPSATQSYLKITVTAMEAPELVPPWKTGRRLSKTLSLSDVARDVAWEKRRRQILRRERRKSLDFESDLTDADLNELKGSIELGFGFNEEGGQRLCNTLPALDLYFAINRQESPVTSPRPGSTTPNQASLSSDSPRSEESWKICYPGDSPEQVKTKLRHWARAVACSIMQAS